MDRKPHIVALLTDFGLQDHYVASIKGAIKQRFAAAEFIDITHGIPPQNIRWGAFQLWASYRQFPSGTFFVAVVDPGVGSERKILYAEAGGYRFIAPDNGLLSWVFMKDPPQKMIELSHAAPAGRNSETFHGRDIMAPAAGEILIGKPPDELGPVISNWVRLPFPAVEKIGSRWQGEILAVDHYGNLITNFKTDELRKMAAASTPWFDGGARRLSEAYAEVPVGGLLAIGGSAGLVEISVRNGNAAEKTQKKAGDTISVEFKT